MIEAKEVTVDSLIDEVRRYHDAGYRFVTTTCVDMGDVFQIYYHFDKDLKLENLKLTVDKNTRVPSISSIYYCSILPENEMQDMFGVKFEGLAVDYGGKFMLGEDSPLTPQAHIEVVRKTSSGASENAKMADALNKEANIGKDDLLSEGGEKNGR
ncbi:NADH-quinone oxidoreductase subunit C [Caldanaerobius polysaccharolyticus]|uniref:NADH-quinone oxidoreductase subunit C n=1 Tax=Caldanaerobius polysaccharolyticus TaxID=44256 RepID=UPI0009FDDB81|nr:NADH-quinone oxidoreductase subunit C [Caldanaerobius polysaccharolyticus]